MVGTLILKELDTVTFCQFLDNVIFFQYGCPGLGIMKRIAFECIPAFAESTLQQVGSQLNLLIHAGFIRIYKLVLKVFNV